MATHFDAHSPERGWPPFLDWLRTRDLNPADVRAVTVNGTSIIAQTMVRGTDGYPIVDGHEVRTRTRRLEQRSTPPLHPSRKASS